MMPIKMKPRTKGCKAPNREKNDEIAALHTSRTGDGSVPSALALGTADQHNQSAAEPRHAGNERHADEQGTENVQSPNDAGLSQEHAVHDGFKRSNHEGHRSGETIE